MKTGLSLVELARQIEANREAKRDFVVTTTATELAPVPAGNGVALVMNGAHEFDPNKLAHDQIATHVGIDRRYYQRMLDNAPELLTANVNHWFKAEPAKRLVRTMHGKARAFLSDGYKPLENEDLAEAVLPTLLDHQLVIMSCEITERRLYIKAVDPRIERDCPSGRKIGDGSHVFYDTLSPAIIISNSEVGAGALSVESGVYTKQCTNLASIAADGMKRRHIGGRHELTDNLQHLLSDETKRATDKAIWLQVRDVVKGAFEEAKFDARVKQLAGMADDKIDGDPVKAVNFATKKFGLTEGEGSSILKHLIEGADLTRYGLFNAVTRTAQDLPDYDRASEFEALGGKLIELPRSQWQEITRAAA